jgi:MFS family permease
VLRANDVGLSFAWTPLALVVMNSTYVVSAYPAGLLSDRIERIWFLVAGLIALIIADIVLARGEEVMTILAGAAIWGLHMGLTQGLFAALVADVAPAKLRGSAFGMFNFVSGVVALAASLLAGGLWQWYGPSATFYAGAFFSAAGLAGLFAWRNWPKAPRQRGENR